MDEAVTTAALAEKTGMGQEKARQIFQGAYTALEGDKEMGRGGDFLLVLKGLLIACWA